MEDLVEASDELEVDNDVDFKGFEQQQIDARIKELTTQAFWSGQTPETVIDKYQKVFKGISRHPMGNRGNQRKRMS